MSADPLLECQGVTKSFSGVRVLRNVSFTLKAGSALGLIGENGAGKSTLLNILGGALQPDEGQMKLEGGSYAPVAPADAARAGIAFVHQELNLFPNLSIAENLFLTAMPRMVGAFVDRRKLRSRATALLAEVGLNLDPDLLVGQLSIGQGQLVEIARALSGPIRILVLDEPTTSLGSREIEVLFQLLARLRARGVAVIYVSHVLGDGMRQCDHLLVLRDGAVVAQGACAAFTSEKLVSHMVGRSLAQLYPERAGCATPAPILDVRQISEAGVVERISFQLHRGEILGISGLMGAGRSELARILFGLDAHRSGQILLEGRAIERLPSADRIRHGMAFLTEDRRAEGLCLDASIADNLGVVALRNYAARFSGLLDLARWRVDLAAMRQAVRLNATARDEQSAGTLSGGNQQKVVLGKWLLAKPCVLILDEPTRGVDVGAKYELYQLILRLADDGAGVLLISSEIEELTGLCDRVLVMSRGRITDELLRSEFDRERILQSALPREVA